MLRSFAYFCRIVALLSILVPAALLTAQSHHVNEILAYTGNPQQQWIVLFQDDRALTFGADVAKSPQTLTLSAVLPALDENSLISGVVELEHGRMESTPLHTFARSTLAKESSKVAELKVSELRARMKFYQARIADLETEITRVNFKLRREAGLDEADRIGERMASVELALRELYKVKEELERRP